MLLSDYITQVQELIHDSSGLDFTNTELTNFINEGRRRVALDFWVCRTYFSNLSAIVGQEIYPMSGGVGGASILAGGSWAVAPSIVFAEPASGQNQATGLPVMSGTAPNLTISQIAMTNWGSGYTSAPLCATSGGTPNPANATGNVTGAGAGSGFVISLQIGAGNQASVAGFNSGDWVNVSGVVGTTEANGNWQIDVINSGVNWRLNLRKSTFVNPWISGGVVNDGVAVLSAVAMVNVIDIFTISRLYPPGLTGTQRAMMQWAVFSVFNAFLRFNPIAAGPPTVWSGYNEQNQFYIYPPQPDQNYSLEIDAFVLPNNLVNLTDIDTQVNLPASELVQYQGAYKALLKAQNFDQADYMDKKYDKRAKEVGLTRLAPRKPNPYQSNWRRIQRGYF